MLDCCGVLCCSVVSAVCSCQWLLRHTLMTSVGYTNSQKRIPAAPAAVIMCSAGRSAGDCPSLANSLLVPSFTPIV